MGYLEIIKLNKEALSRTSNYEHADKKHILLQLSQIEYSFRRRNKINQIFSPTIIAIITETTHEFYEVELSILPSKLNVIYFWLALLLITILFLVFFDGTNKLALFSVAAISLVAVITDKTRKKVKSNLLIDKFKTLFKQ